MPLKSNYGVKQLDKPNPFFNNFGKKTIAVVIAIMLWIVANLEFDIEKTYNIPVKYTNLNPDLIITNNPPEEITYKIKGPRTELSTLISSTSVINVDLSQFTTGVSNIRVESDSMNLPKEVDITSVSPAEITIDLDKLVTKKVNVEPVFDELEKGFEIVGELEYSPRTVEIKGPQEMLSKINTIETRPISLEGEKSEFSIEVPLQFPNKLITASEDEEVKVSFNIQEENLAKEFNNVDIIFKNFNGLDYTPTQDAKAMIIFDGPYSIINSLSSNDIEVYVDARDIGGENTGKHKLRVKVDYPDPDNLNLNKLSPETLEIKVN